VTYGQKSEPDFAGFWHVCHGPKVLQPLEWKDWQNHAVTRVNV